MGKLAELKTRDTDRQKITDWLDHINEHDPACREEVLLACKADLECRAYYVKRYTEDCPS